MPWTRFSAKKIHNVAVIPYRGTPESAGFDLFAMTDIVLLPGTDHEVPLGLLMQFPDGYYGQFKSRSGHARKLKVEVMAGTIDKDYSGEIILMCRTRATTPHTIPNGTACAQIVLLPTFYKQQHADEVDDLWAEPDQREGARGAGGFGSTTRLKKTSKSSIQISFSVNS